MKRCNLELEFVTPAFLGGAEPASTCEWRAASVRGQLRWWLRAVAGGAFGGDLDEVRQVETDFFGSTGQASRVRVQTLGTPKTLSKGEQAWGRKLGDQQLAEQWGLEPGHPDWQSTLNRLRSPWQVNPLLYLGYGCLEFQKGRGNGVKLARPCLAPEGHPVLRFQWNVRPGRRPTSQDVPELWDHTVWAWLHLGGIGSRCRRGFGSLRLRTAEGVPDSWQSGDRDSFVTRAQRLLQFASQPTTGGHEPRWSHFSRHSAIYIAFGDGHESWDEAMVHAGGWLMAFRRRYGYPRDVRHGYSSLADRDYTWAKQAGRRQPPEALPDRAGFGLPLPFGRRPEQIVSWGSPGDDNRRASPLLIHIARFGGRFFPVLTHLPAQMLPNGRKQEKVRFKGLPQPARAPTDQQRSVVRNFLDDLESRNLIERIAS